VTTLAKSRLQIAQQLVAEIKRKMEDFYHVGMKLKRLRDDMFYAELGYKTFEECCKHEFEYTRTYAHELITSAEYRERLPVSAQRGQQWTEFSVRPLKRLADKQDAARVARKIVAEIDKNPEIKLTSALVRKVVDNELGIKKTQANGQGQRQWRQAGGLHRPPYRND
jgi:hypothetical protein